MMRAKMFSEFRNYEKHDESKNKKDNYSEFNSSNFDQKNSTMVEIEQDNEIKLKVRKL